MQPDSVYQRRSKLTTMISNGVIDVSVLNEVIINGRAINEEAPLWDFKKELPIVDFNKSSPEQKQNSDAKFCEIVKDCVAFYNSHGGYLIAGIEDGTGKVIGISSGFDAADINKRIKGATGTSIETIFRSVSFNNGTSEIDVGLLFIPKRLPGENPSQFKKNATANTYSRKAYNQNDFYFRHRDTCVPAQTPEDFEFLYSDRSISEVPKFNAGLENNLPTRDPDLVELRGRDVEITSLWRWLSDKFSPVHILSGLGGLGRVDKVDSQISVGMIQDCLLGGGFGSRRPDRCRVAAY